ncbi:Flp pilus assembly protein CpaB [Chthonobacter rhizosphaerae]|uniref:Flp pilus assembly protein CpaB n=1 Tax=Chthonobacter rhizosphaerae TaxID=2735553 RepID=UPI0015EE6CD5|nr:RcpC/CpaB family pilus assembly protein [Chthonobacter rhizosphaerae]
MNWKLIVAIMAGLVTAGLLYLWTESVRNEQTAYGFLKLRADVAVARGQAVTDDMLDDPVVLPESFGTLVNLAVPDAEAHRQWLRDRTAAADIPAGAVLLFQYFDDSDGGRLTSMITPGKRALTISVDAAEAVGHFVEPGSFVDVLGTVDEPVKPAAPTSPALSGQTGVPPGQPAPQTQPPTQATAQTATPAAGQGPQAPLSPENALISEMLKQLAPADQEAMEAYMQQSQDFQVGISRRTRVVTRTFLQNVKVLAVGTATTPEGAAAARETAYSHVTLEVTPAEAELLIFAMGQASGRLNLVLRNPGDSKVEELPSVNWTRM